MNIHPMAPFILGAMIMLILLISNPDESQTKDKATYCEMVASFKSTNGQYGWPDYRGIARKACK